MKISDVTLNGTQEVIGGTRSFRPARVVSDILHHWPPQPIRAKEVEVGELIMLNAG